MIDFMEVTRVYKNGNSTKMFLNVEEIISMEYVHKLALTVIELRNGDKYWVREKPQELWRGR